ncbi:MAG: energy-coupling factor transporter transmembrane protein EcfT, partial [Spirochaetales bacterium]|nr:energy-coupling factor transporter transmembrane protein EcfT [Spirochaetales bacterium]
RGSPKVRKRKPSSKEGRKFGFALRYEECDSFMHRLSGVTKFISFIIWIVFALTTFDIRFLIPATFVSFILLSLSKVPLSKFKPYIIRMLTIIGFNALFIFLFSPDQGTRYLGGQTLLLGSAHHRYALSAQTLFYLLVVSLKYFSIFPMALLFVTVTHPSAFASSLNRLGLSYRVSYAVALALRYLPEVTKNYLHILHAQMARGVSLSSDVPLKKRFSSLARVITPLVLSSIDRIEVITNAMVLRGFGRLERRTWYRAQRLTLLDWVVMALFGALLGFSLFSRFVKNVMFWYPF